uniref:Uncharacterized protein n=1 Tax=Mycena chlorophos TaxID=658473 RepID=A0ABQ0KZ13_MYCCL|nr:predicted protein [Mycena chlorophos]
MYGRTRIRSGGGGVPGDVEVDNSGVVCDEAREFSLASDFASPGSPLLWSSCLCNPTRVWAAYRPEAKKQVLARVGVIEQGYKMRKRSRKPAVKV